MNLDRDSFVVPIVLMSDFDLQLQLIQVAYFCVLRLAQLLWMLAKTLMLSSERLTLPGSQ
jgi:hypothetical protein